jgi:hypothetical protein
VLLNKRSRKAGTELVEDGRDGVSLQLERRAICVRLRACAFMCMYSKYV